MTTLAAAGYPSNAARTNAEMKQFLEDLLSVMKEQPGGAVFQALTIATGSVTPAVNASRTLVIDTEAAAATDDLDRLTTTNLPDGGLVLLRIAADARNVVVRHAQGAAGQIFLADAANLTLDVTTSWLMLERRGADFYEIDRRYGNDKAGARAFLESIQASVASATTLVLTSTARSVNVTGTTTTTAITLPDGQFRLVKAAAAWPITAGASLIIEGVPSGQTVTLRAGSKFIVAGEASGVVRLFAFSAGPIYEALRATVASAGTLNLDNVLSNTASVTGTTTTTAITLADGQRRHVTAAAAWPITTGANLIIEGVPSGVTVTCVAGDTMDVFGEASSVVRIRNCSAVRGRTLLQIVTVAAAATADLDLPAGYDHYEVEFDNLVPVSAANLWLRCSIDGGSTFAASASDYGYEILFGSAAASSGDGSNAAAQIVVNGGASDLIDEAASFGGICGMVKIWSAAGTSIGKQISGQTSHRRNANVCFTSSVLSAQYLTSTAAVNALRFLFSTGNISTGTFKLYGVR